MRRIAALLALTMFLAACSGDDGGGATPEVDEDAGPMVRALSLVPDVGGNSESVIVNDYAAAAEELGLERPDQGEADEDDVADWFIPLTSGREEVVGALQPSAFFSSGNFLEDEAWRDEVGWAPIDIDVVAEVGPSDDHTGYYAFTGDFDPEAIEDAVTDDDNPFPIEVETDEVAGVEVYTWGEDDEIDPEAITPVRPLGRGGRMAVLGEHTILWAWQTEAMEDGIEAATGEADSLADNDELSALAEAMDEAGAHAALFSTDEEIFEGADTGGPEPLEPYLAFATGVVADEGGGEVVVGILHEDDDIAEENVERLEEIISGGTSSRTRQPWVEIFPGGDLDTDGAILTAKLRVAEPPQATIWVQLAFTRDSLLAT
jgi:hypothetical protein